MQSSINSRKTKIVATLGPASSDAATIENMIKSGLNVARFNFSHGTAEEHSKRLKIIREVAQQQGKYIGILQDLCGPKMRLGDIEGEILNLEVNDKISLKRFDGSCGNRSVLTVEAFDPVNVMQAGERALLSDGRVKLVAETINNDEVICRVVFGGTVRSRSGIAVPQSNLNLPCLTPKDLQDLEWSIENDIDYLALSFVSCAQDIYDLKEEINKRGGGHTQIIAKIERAIAMENLHEITLAADGLMVARGDLALELPFEKVPSAQKTIIETANAQSKPVITATQMLQSMITAARPTRAEVSDVYYSVMDGTDATMLSEETTIGEHPEQVIKVLDDILSEADHQKRIQRTSAIIQACPAWHSIADSVCYGAVSASAKLNAAVIIACTETGATARLMSKYRPNAQIFGITPNKSTLTKLSLYWGVEPVYIDRIEEHEDEVSASMKVLKQKIQLETGSRIVITSGLRPIGKTIDPTKITSTNKMEIRIA